MYRRYNPGSGKARGNKHPAMLHHSTSALRPTAQTICRSEWPVPVDNPCLNRLQGKGRQLTPLVGACFVAACADLGQNLNHSLSIFGEDAMTKFRFKHHIIDQDLPEGHY